MEEDLKKLLGLSDDEYINGYKGTKSFKYKKNIIIEALNLIGDATKNINKFYAHNPEPNISIIIIYFLLMRDNKGSGYYPSKDYMLYICNHSKHDNYSRAIFLASLSKFPNVNYSLHVINLFFKVYLSKREILDNFEDPNLLNFIKTKKNQDLFEYLQELAIKKINNSDEFIRILLNYFYINNFELCLKVAKIQEDDEWVFTKILEMNQPYLIENIFGMLTMELINILYLKNDFKKLLNKYRDQIDSIIMLSNIKICDELYYDLMDQGLILWRRDKRYSNALLEFAFVNKKYDIILDHLNNKDYDATININLNLAKLFNINGIIDYKNISLIFKNCKELDYGKILDYIDIRFVTMNYEFPEFFANYTAPDLNFLKKFLRLNSYLNNLERFNILYDRNLLEACCNYIIFPEVYLDNIIKNNAELTNLVTMRTYFYKDKSNVTTFSKFIEKNNMQVDDFTLMMYLRKSKAAYTNKVGYGNNIMSYIFNDIHIGKNTYKYTPFIILYSCLFTKDRITDLDDDIIKMMHTLVDNK